ncbi:MAG: nuclear transport factor 2 family protein [Pseudomonadota bacterium]
MNAIPSATGLANDQSDFDAVADVLNAYFDGLYDGDVDKLRSIFHEDATLKGNAFRKTREEWLNAVTNRPIPRTEGMEYGFEIQSLEIVGDQAMAKLDVPLLTTHSIDYLGLLKEEGRWRVVNKMFTLL